MRRDSGGGLAASLVFVAMLSGQTSAATDEGLKRDVDAVFSDVQGVAVPGYAVGILRGGELWYGRGFGAANLDYGLPITTRSVFNVASLSKQFTAACLAILVLQGRVSLDDSVREYLPEMPARLEPHPAAVRARRERPRERECRLPDVPHGSAPLALTDRQHLAGCPWRRCCWRWCASERGVSCV